MYIINKEGKKLDEFYWSHDRFLEDIDDYISDNYNFIVSKENSVDLLDVVCGHLLYWYYKALDDEPQAKIIYKDLFQQNEIINRLIKIGDPTPELVIYEFDGISVYDELRDGNVILKESYDTIEINLDYNGILYLTAEEFKELGGEINLPEGDEDDIMIDFFGSSGSVYFFMNSNDEIEMNNYLIKCVEELNKIYNTLGMKIIEF
jgi:hypothetical protein